MMPEWQQSFYDDCNAGVLDGTPEIFLQAAWDAYFAVSNDAVPYAYLPLENGFFLRTPARNVVWTVIDGGGPDGSDALLPRLRNERASAVVQEPAADAPIMEGAPARDS